MSSRLYFLVFAFLFSSHVFAKEWAFDVYLDKKKMGTHTFVLDDANRMTSIAKFKVKVFFIDAYNYDHVSKEQWQNGCLSAIEAKTIENKKYTKVTGELEDEQFNISNGAQNQSFSGCVMTFAYWNPKTLTQTKLLNPQNGEYLSTKITQVGNETIEVKGKQAEAARYLLQGFSEGKTKLNIDLWYDQNNNWVALESITPEGNRVIYKLR